MTRGLFKNWFRSATAHDGQTLLREYVALLSVCGGQTWECEAKLPADKATLKRIIKEMLATAPVAESVARRALKDAFVLLACFRPEEDVELVTPSLPHDADGIGRLLDAATYFEIEQAALRGEIEQYTQILFEGDEYYLKLQVPEAVRDLNKLVAVFGKYAAGKEGLVCPQSCLPAPKETLKKGIKAAFTSGSEDAICRAPFVWLARCVPDEEVDSVNYASAETGTPDDANRFLKGREGLKVVVREEAALGAEWDEFVRLFRARPDTKG